MQSTPRLGDGGPEASVLKDNNILARSGRIGFVRFPLDKLDMEQVG